MAIQDNCVLWNKMENGALVSQIGPNGVVTGVPAFPAAKFNNGILSSINNYGTFNNIYPIGASIIEFWWKPSFASGAAFWDYVILGTGGDRIQTVNITPAVSHLSVLAFQGGVRKAQYRHKPVWAANDLMHIAVVVDSAAGPTNRLKLYIDGALEAVTAYTDDNAFVFGAPETFNVGINNTNKNSARAVIDNIKIYDSTADLAGILANRNNEGWPVTGGKRMIDGGLLSSNMIGGNVLIG